MDDPRCRTLGDRHPRVGSFETKYRSPWRFKPRCFGPWTWSCCCPCGRTVLRRRAAMAWRRENGLHFIVGICAAHLPFAAVSQRFRQQECFMPGVYWPAAARCKRACPFITFRVILNLRCASQDIFFPFQVLQFQFQFTFPAIPVCLGMQRTRATPQEHRFEVLRQPNTAILFASDAPETARALCGLDRLWRWRREEFWRVGGPVLGQPLVWGKFGSWVGVCTCISRSLVCWQPWPLRV
jgi:hypothetical protein